MRHITKRKRREKSAKQHQQHQQHWQQHHKQQPPDPRGSQRLLTPPRLSRACLRRRLSHRLFAGGGDYTTSSLVEIAVDAVGSELSDRSTWVSSATGTAISAYYMRVSYAPSRFFVNYSKYMSDAVTSTNLGSILIFVARNANCCKTTSEKKRCTTFCEKNEGLRTNHNKQPNVHIISTNTYLDP